MNFDPNLDILIADIDSDFLDIDGFNIKNNEKITCLICKNIVSENKIVECPSCKNVKKKISLSKIIFYKINLYDSSNIAQCPVAKKTNFTEISIF